MCVHVPLFHCNFLVKRWWNLLGLGETLERLFPCKRSATAINEIEKHYYNNYSDFIFLV